MLTASVVALLGALLVPTMSAEAAPEAVAGAGCQVRLASVESRVAPRALETKDPATILRGDLERSFERIDCARERIDRSYDVMAELTYAESIGSKGRVRATVTVKAIVRDGSGSLLAVVQGKARGEDHTAARGSLEREILQAAAAQASASVPEAIRRARGASR
jgi:hypothetical protein